MDKIRKPIFIVGCGRSGTSLLFQILQKHPQLAATRGYPDGEDHLGWVSHGDCIIAGLGNAAIGKGHTGYHYCLYMDQSDVTPDIVQSMHSYYHDEVLGGDTSRRVLNKCPHLSNKLRYVRSIFPDAKFIHVIRDCLPVVSSWILQMQTVPEQVLYWPEIDFPCFWVLPSPVRGNKAHIFRNNNRIFPGGGTRLLVDYWEKVNRNIPLQLIDTPDHLLMVKYEDLCCSPFRTLRSITEFCELDLFTEVPLQIAPERNSRYHQVLTTEQIRNFEELAHRTRVLFNYIA